MSLHSSLNVLVFVDQILQKTMTMKEHKMRCLFALALTLSSSLATAMDSSDTDLVGGEPYSCALQHEQVKVHQNQEAMTCGGNQSCISCFAGPLLSDGVYHGNLMDNNSMNPNEQIFAEISPVAGVALKNTEHGMPWSMFVLCLVPYFVTLVFALPRTYIGSKTYIVSIIHRYSGINTLLLPLGLMVTRLTG